MSAPVPMSALSSDLFSGYQFFVHILVLGTMSVSSTDIQELVLMLDLSTSFWFLVPISILGTGWYTNKRCN